MENANPSLALGSFSQQPPATTHTKLMARVNKLLKMRQTIDSRLSKTINELTNQSSDSETFCPRERIKELKLRTQRRNNFEEELFKDMFPIVEELAYHKELLVNFMILEDLGSVIDGRQSKVVLRKPFVQASKLTYDESLGLIRFAHRDDEVVFRMPQRTKELDLVSPLKKDKFEAFFVESLKARKKGFKHVLEKRKGYYKACMNLGRTYKRDRETLEKRKTNHVGIIKLKE
ncbi:hypothetical protein Tco_0396919 [Tanacetum coccineum]